MKTHIGKKPGRRVEPVRRRENVSAEGTRRERLTGLRPLSARPVEGPFAVRAAG